MDLYTSTTLKCSRLVTQHYSTSFTLGIKTLNRKYHFPIYAIYGFVRFADEIVDTFHEHDKAELLEKFEKDTFAAIDQRISLNPVLHSFQMIVNKYKIDRDLIESFLESMEMDLSESSHTKGSYRKYIYGSAEVVGLMCLKVFCDGDHKRFEELKPAACRLGAAFQKVNFLRDMQSDFTERGRVYFPDVSPESFEWKDKKLIESDILDDFKAALQGIRNLPEGARWGVYLAYVYYKQLFRKIRRLPPGKVLSKRVRVQDFKKVMLLFATYFGYRLRVI